MQYQNIRYGKFLKRPNRFIAHIIIDAHEEVVHVKNTGRCAYDALVKPDSIIIGQQVPDEIL